MPIQKFLAVLSVAFLIPAVSVAQPWNGIIAASRATDWSGAGVEGGIPSRTTVCATLNPGATAAQINTAIQNCPANQVVKLTAGTYNLTDGLEMKSGVVLRGAGADQTFLVFTGDTPCAGSYTTICFLGGSSADWSGSSNVQPGASQTATWTGGFAKGSNQIVLSNIGSNGIEVGTYLYLDQENDIATNNGLFICEESATSPACSLEGGKANPGRVTNGKARHQAEIVKVTACSPSCSNGATFTITPSLQSPNWTSSKNAAAWWSSEMIENSGIEDLSVDATNSGGQFNVAMFNAVNTWVKGTRQIRTCQCNRSIIQMGQSTHVTVQDNNLYGTSGHSINYGVETYFASNVLVMNNIFQHVVAPMMLHANIGSVYAYNYAINNTYDDGRTPLYHWMTSQISGHSGGVIYALAEGNVGQGLGFDVFHGNQVLNTAFRNLFLGSDPNRIDNTTAVRIESWNRYFNIVGNVLGTPGYTDTYQGGSTKTIYNLGAGRDNGSVTVPDDSLVATTLMRWGNYDVVNAATRFQSSEVPTGLSQYANTVPSSQTLPSSFFLSSEPAWWPVSKPWPPIGPDVSGGNITGYAGHAFTIPAQDCFRNVMGGPADGSGSPLSFNRTSCYSPSGTDTVAPGAPTNLRIP